MTDTEINEAVARKLGYINHPPVWVKGKASYSDLPDFCHSISAAWEIVERMNCNCHIVSVNSEKNIFWVQFIDSGEIWNGPMERTAPIAICKAFLALDDKS